MGMLAYFYAMQAKQKVIDALKNERGDTNIISIVLILCIVVGLVALFNENVTKLVNDLWEKIFGKTEPILGG